MLKNGDFMSGWDDMPPTPSYLINQQPKHWELTITPQGENLYGSGDKAQGIPECVHKLQSQLPPHEHLGAKDALILSGDITYKIFSANESFATQLKQTVTGLQPGSQGQLKAPILLVLHRSNDMYAAESGVWVDTTGSDQQDDWTGGWANAGMMGSRNWYTHTVDFTVPASGQVTVYMRVKSKWNLPVDFFIDGITMEAQMEAQAGQTAPGPPPSKPITTEHTRPPVPVSKPPSTAGNVVQISAPAGMTVVTQIGTEADTIVITVPPGVSVEER